MTVLVVLIVLGGVVAWLSLGVGFVVMAGAYALGWHISKIVEQQAREIARLRHEVKTLEKLIDQELERSLR